MVWVCPNRYTLTFSLSLDWFHYTLQLPDPPALEPGRGARAAPYFSLPFLSSCLQTTHCLRSAWLMCASRDAGFGNQTSHCRSCILHST